MFRMVDFYRHPHKAHKYGILRQ